MGLVRLPCFFNCLQRIERYSTTSSKMIKRLVVIFHSNISQNPGRHVKRRPPIQIRRFFRRASGTSGRADRSPFQNMAGPRPISAAILFLVLGLSSLTTSGIAYVFHMNTVTVSFWLIVLALFISASSPAFNLNLSRYLSPGAIHPTT